MSETINLELISLDVDLGAASDAAVARVREAVLSVAPSARIDRHESWMSPVRSFMGLVTLLAAGLVLLMATATAAVVVLAARAGLETHRATIEVLHMLGSTDVQVARLFQRRLALDAANDKWIGGAGRVQEHLAGGVVLVRCCAHGRVPVVRGYTTIKSRLV